jgi:hypothetical protein
MYWYSLNPLLNLLLRERFPTFSPILLHLLYSRSYPTLCSLSFYPKPTRLDSIEIRRVARPKEL